MKNILSVILIVCVLLSGIATVSFQDVSATDGVSLLNAAGEVTYNDAAAWGLYYNHADASNTIDGTGPQSFSWLSITDNEDPAYIYGGGENSIKFKGNVCIMATELKDLVKDKYYQMSFKYFAPTTSVDAIGGVYLYAKGTKVGEEGKHKHEASSAVKSGENYSGETGKWNTYTFKFTAESTDLYFGLKPSFTSGYEIYFDDFELTEIDEDPDAPCTPDIPEKQPVDCYKINFDDFDVAYSNPDVLEIIEGPAKKDGTTSKATHVKPGEYQYSVFSNWDTVTTDTDEVFTVAVKENTLYEFSYSYYINLKSGRIPYLAMYYDYKNDLVLGATRENTVKEWVTKTVRFTTLAGQEKLSIGFDLGKTTIDMYIDDISLTEIKAGVISSAEKLSYCEDTFNNFVTSGLNQKITANKSTVIKCPVEASTQYTFGITANSSKKSNSRIFISFDGVNPIAKSTSDAPSSVITSNGKNVRYGYNIVTDASGYIYVVIENNDGSLKFENPTLFKTKSLSTGIDIGREELPKTSLTVNKGGKLKELELAQGGK